MIPTIYGQALEAMEAEREQALAQVEKLTEAIAALSQLAPAPAPPTTRIVSPLVTERSTGERKARPTKTGDDRQRRGSDGLTPKKRAILDAIAESQPVTTASLAKTLGRTDAAPSTDIAASPASVPAPRPAYLDRYETVWTPHRNAPSLTESAPGLGTTLGTPSFAVHMGRRTCSGNGR